MGKQQKAEEDARVVRTGRITLGRLAAIVVVVFVVGCRGDNESVATASTNERIEAAPSADAAPAAAEGQAEAFSVPPPAWIPPGWLLGYWSTSDNVWMVAAEPGFVDVVVSGSEALVTYTIQDWSDERGDVFSLSVVRGPDDHERQEWESNRRLYRDGGDTWVAQAFGDDGTRVIEMEFRYAGADIVSLLLTVGGEQYAMRLNRDE